ERLHAAGAREVHAERVVRAWIAGRRLDERTSSHDAPFPRSLIDALPAIESDLASIARVESEHPDEDGSSRLLLALRDGRTIESVLLPREGVCVSTQIGCAVGCVFCMTGRSGLIRQLASAEIVAQVALARQRRRVRRVVLMGMGEPSHNIDA